MANVGSLDRILRVVVGLALLVFAFTSASPYAWLGFIGFIPLLTALVSWCPLYTLVGLNTCPVKRS